MYNQNRQMQGPQRRMGPQRPSYGPNRPQRPMIRNQRQNQPSRSLLGNPRSNQPTLGNQSKKSALSIENIGKLANGLQKLQFGINLFKAFKK